MADYSMSPLNLLVANQQKGYVGLHIEQGVPLLDRDLNLLHDLIAANARSLATRYIGNGIPAGADGFAIQALPTGQNSQDFRIAAGTSGPGSYLVGGVEVTIPAAITYKAQSGLPALTTPTAAQPNPRVDTVYLDVSFVEVDGSSDPDLTNGADVGMQTSVRLKPVWVVRVAEGAGLPTPSAGHAFAPLAQLQRVRTQDTIVATMITDLRQSRLTMADMERRLALLERLLVVPAFVELPLPQFLPRSGVMNQAITINGTNLDVGNIQVRFGTTLATLVGAPSATQVVARIPSGLTPAGTPVSVKITLTNIVGSDTSDDTFTVQAAPALADPGAQFTPNHGLPGQQVTINGFNFNAPGGLKVAFGTVLGTIVGTPTNTQVVVQVPTDIVPVGSSTADVKLTVTTSAGAIVSDDVFRAEINIPAPSFVAAPNPQFLPRNGVGGQLITLNGQNFNFAPVSVKFENTNATISGTPTATQIACLVPAAMVPAGGPAKAVKITVTTPGGSALSTDLFTITGP